MGSGGRQLRAAWSSDIDEVYELAAEAAERYHDPQGETLSEVIEAKVAELERRFVQLYGSDDDFWTNLLRLNS